MNETAMNGDTL